MNLYSTCPHLCCPRTSPAVAFLPSSQTSSPPPLHPTSLPHVLSERRWIALLCDINNMSYCWSVRGKACELSIPSHWLHDWDAYPHFFLSFYPSNSLWPSIRLSLFFHILRSVSFKAASYSSPFSPSCPRGIKTYWNRLRLPIYSWHRNDFNEKIKAFLGH